jgi:hypothetical protein
MLEESPVARHLYQVFKDSRGTRILNKHEHLGKNLSGGGTSPANGVETS